MGKSLKKKASFGQDILAMLPAIIFCLSILAVRTKIDTMPLSDIYWSPYSDNTIITDIYSYYKALMVMIAGVLAAIVLGLKFASKKIEIKSKYIYVPAAVYLVLSLLSSLLSDYRYFALKGAYQHYEGIFVLISYIVVMFFLYNIINSHRRVGIIVFTALAAALLLGIIGLSQALGKDLFATHTWEKFITPNVVYEDGSTAWERLEAMAAEGTSPYTYKFTRGEVYQSVYNPNYVPFYLCLIVPLVAMLFIWLFRSKKIPLKLLSLPILALFGLILYNFFAANSASGFFGLFIMAIAALLLLNKRIFKWIVPILCLLLVAAAVMGTLSDRWLPEVKSKFNNLISDFSQNFKIYAQGEDINTDYENAPGSVFAPIDYIETEEGRLGFSVNGNLLQLIRDDANGQFIIADAEGILIPLMYTDEEGVYAIADERYHDYVTVRHEGVLDVFYITLRTRGTDWRFIFREGTFFYVNKYGYEVTLTKIPHIGFEGHYGFGSWRGLIWATTIPMLKDRILLGSGADTYMFVYPQNDYATLYSIKPGTDINIITDKTHNIYMQYWVQTGLISLIAWIVMVGFYIFGAVKYFWKRGIEDFSDFVNVGIFLGILGFLTTAFFNDGSVNTMPMFYTMLGTGMAINNRENWA